MKRSDPVDTSESVNKFMTLTHDLKDVSPMVLDQARKSTKAKFMSQKSNNMNSS